MSWQKATPLCKHWGHADGEWFYACCACSGMPGGCGHCETDWDGDLLFPDGVIPNDHEAAVDWCGCRVCTPTDRPSAKEQP